jgi:hypothetical protein
VVDRRGAELDRELHARAWAELVAVHAQAEAGRPSRLEHRARLLDVERAVLAEDVDPARVRRAGAQHVAGDERDVVVRPVRVLGRDDVRAEERDVVGELRRDLAAAPLRLDVEAVARLDLDVGDAGPQRLGAAAGGERRELLGGGRAGRLGRHADPAGLVRRAGHPGGELVAAVAGEYEVRVAVDEARDDAAAARVDAPVAGRARALDRRHAPVLDHQRGVADDPERAVAERGLVGDEHADVVDDQRGHSASRSAAATSKPVCAPSRTIQRPPARTWRTSGADAANTAAATPCSGRVPASRTESSERFTRSATAPASSRPASGQPSAR